jgi:DNA mismatch endonuclease (patch repair protein)
MLSAPTPERSALMKSIRRKHTEPEMTVRRFLHSNGLRYRLHSAGLPGTPDIVLSRYCTAIFVHGCFWHGHDCAHGAVVSRTNAAFWKNKLDANRARDSRKAAALVELGWWVETIWECEASQRAGLAALLRRIRRRDRRA